MSSFPGEKERKWPLTALAIFCAALVVGSFAFRWELLKSRQFDPDEFEHLHSAWSLSKGQIPFRDYFEHHTPGLYFVLAPTISLFHIDESADNALAFVFFARRLMWLLALVIIGLTFYLGTYFWADLRVACMATLLLIGNIVFLGKTLEIRPDVLSTAFWLGALVLAVRAMSFRQETRKVSWNFFASGLCLGLGLMSSQKLLLAGPGMALSAVWHCWDRRLPGTIAWRLRNILWQSLGTALPILATLAFFGWHGAVHPFIENNFLLNLGWEQETTVGATLHWLVLRDPYFMAVAVPGIVLGLIDLFRVHGASAAGILLFANMLGLVLGLFLIPVPYPQYCVLFLPLLALYGGAFLVRFIQCVQNRLRRGVLSGHGQGVEAGLLGALFCFMLFGSCAIAQPRAFAFWFYPGVGVLTVVLTGLLLRIHKPDLALAVILTPGIIYSLQQMEWMKGLSNKEMVSNLRYVLEKSKPNEIVLDGWSGLGTFRPHAWYYAFTHGGLRRLIEKEKLQKLEEGLLDGTVAPRIVILDKSLAEVSPSLTDFVTSHYQESGKGFIWIRRQNGSTGPKSDDANR